MRISDWSSDVCSSDLSTTSSCERAAESGEALLGAAAALQAVIDETIEPRHRARPAVVRLDPRPAGVRPRPPRGTVVHHPDQLFRIDRKSAVQVQRWSVRVDLGVPRTIKKKKTK